MSGRVGGREAAGLVSKTAREVQEAGRGEEGGGRGEAEGV